MRRAYVTKPTRISPHYRATPHIRIVIGLARGPADRIFADEACTPSMVVPRPVVVQPRAVVLSAGVLLAVVTRRAAEGGLRGLAVDVVAVAGAQGLGGVCECQGVVVGIGEEVLCIAGRNRSAAGGEALAQLGARMHLHFVNAASSLSSSAKPCLGLPCAAAKR
jgi:hypothetical protein